MRVLAIYEDEAYPVYSLEVRDKGDGGWIPDVELPLETLSEDEVKDYERVEALYDAWQDRLKMLYKGAKPGLTSHMEDPGQLVKNVND